jgi:[acyl-carrier-protein] S-malonyltransferase
MTAPDTLPVATVAGTPIVLGSVKERLAELRRGRLGRQIPPEGGEAERLLRWGVQELVTRAVLLHEAAIAGLLPDPGPARDPVSSGDAESVPALAPKAGTVPALGPEAGSVPVLAPEAGSVPVLAPEVVQRLFDRATAEVTVPDSDLRAYHERNIDLYERPETRRVRYVIADSGPMARAVLEREQTGPRAAAAGDVRQGVLPTLRRGELTGSLEDAVFAAALGELVGPYLQTQGWMAARVEVIVPASTASFDEVRGAIQAELLEAARARAFDDWVASRRAALAVVEPGYEHPGHPLHGLPHHRH